ncbi:MAG: HD domain-containing protein [Kiritimatiellaeota bacterium]|nr:HD domain-containing protein [Kiritimatiellota bacterium]
MTTFRGPTGALPRLLMHKEEHSLRVAMEAQRVMIGEGWDKFARHLGDAAALMHDTARYLQFHAFGTFRDSESFDHAEAAVGIIQQQGWLVEMTEEEQYSVLTAIRLHNKPEVPPSVTGFAADLSHIVRDADKLDIFLILEQAVNNGTLAQHPEIALGGLPMEGAPTPEVVEAVCARQPVNYAAIRVFADFVLIQVGWLNGGLHFKTSARLVQERGTLKFHSKLLKTLTDDHSGIDRCCAAAKQFLKEKASIEESAPCPDEKAG